MQSAESEFYIVLRFRSHRLLLTRNPTFLGYRTLFVFKYVYIGKNLEVVFLDAPISVESLLNPLTLLFEK